ncbi:MAG: hypothetical protein WCQ49_02425 [Candidatus Saccharibacteria bacterium]
MNKTIILFFVLVFGLIGGYLPTIFGEDIFSLWGILGSTIGGFFGIWLGYLLSKRVG